MTWFFGILALVLALVLWKVLSENRALKKKSRHHLEEFSSKLDEKSQSVYEEKNRLLAVLESMEEGVAVIDDTQKILLVNSNLASSFELDKNRVRGQFFWEVFRDVQINAMIEKTLKEKTSIKNEHTVLLSDRTFAIQVSPVFANQEFVGAVAIFHDISKIKALERMRTEFVANVSHELKTPLTSILGFVETLKEGAMEDSQNRGKFLAIIEEHAQKLHKLIEDLLSLSKFEAPSRELAVEKINFDEIVDKLILFFERPIRLKRITVYRKITPEPFALMGEPKALTEAFSNLVDNALKYNQEDGELWISAHYRGDEAVIEIKDTGIGIPEKDLARIFERFYRVDKSRSRETGGSGLGLSIAKHIFERHQGRIEVKSGSGQGSSFIIHLPVVL